MVDLQPAVWILLDWAKSKASKDPWDGLQIWTKPDHAPVLPMFRSRELADAFAIADKMAGVIAAPLEDLKPVGAVAKYAGKFGVRFVGIDMDSENTELLSQAANSLSIFMEDELLTLQRNPRTVPRNAFLGQYPTTEFASQ